MKKSRKSKAGIRVMILVFYAMLIVPTLLWGVLTLADRTLFPVMESLSFDTGENRALEAFPDHFTGNAYPAQVEAYYNDRVPFRSVMIRTLQRIESGPEGWWRHTLMPVLAKTFYDTEDKEAQLALPEEMAGEQETPQEPAQAEEEEQPHTTHTEEITEQIEASYLSYGRTTYTCTECGQTRTVFTEKPVDTSYFPLMIEGGYTVIGRFDRLFYRGDASLDYYMGTNVMTEGEMAEILGRMRSLQAVCDAQGKRLVFLIIPNKEQVYAEYMPTLEIASERKRAEVFADYVRENSDLSVLYPLRELREAKVYGDTYYAFDTHWNNFGAFVGVQALYEALGMDMTPLSEAQMIPTPQIATGLVATGGLSPEAFTDDEDCFVVYRPEITVLSEEGLTDGITGYTPVYRSVSDHPGGERLAFVGDSFRAWMTQYLQKDFTTVTMVQREDMAEAAGDIREADVIVFCAVERYDKDLFARIGMLEAILTQE